MLPKITLCAFEFLRVRNAIKHRTVISWTTLISSFAVCIHYISIVTVDTGQRWVCGIIVKCEHIINSAPLHVVRKDWLDFYGWKPQGEQTKLSRLDYYTCFFYDMSDS